MTIVKKKKKCTYKKSETLKCRLDKTKNIQLDNIKYTDIILHTVTIKAYILKSIE